MIKQPRHRGRYFTKRNKTQVEFVTKLLRDPKHDKEDMRMFPAAYRMFKRDNAIRRMGIEPYYPTTMPF